MNEIFFGKLSSIRQLNFLLLFGSLNFSMTIRENFTFLIFTITIICSKCLIELHVSIGVIFKACINDTRHLRLQLIFFFWLLFRQVVFIFYFFLITSTERLFNFLLLLKVYIVVQLSVALDITLESVFIIHLWLLHISRFLFIIFSLVLFFVNCVYFFRNGSFVFILIWI